MRSRGASACENPCKSRTKAEAQACFVTHKVFVAVNEKHTAPHIAG